MKLIDRYVMEVGRNLPLVRGRSDIEKELRSTLQDMLEDRARKAGRPADEDLEMELLREYGAPDKVASTYNPAPYLIGPRMFPMYLMVLKIVLTVLTSVLLIVTVVQVMTQTPLTGASFVTALLKGLGDIFPALLSAFGSVTIVFAILERVQPTPDFELDEGKEWDPASLRKTPEPDDVKPAEAIAAIVFTIIALSFFNLKPDWIALFYSDGEKFTRLPLLTEAFFRWLPLINLSWMIEILLNILLLRTGRWNRYSRLVAIGMKVLQIAIAVLMLTGPSILAITPESLQAAGIFGDAEAARLLGTMAQWGVRIGLAFAIVGSVVEIGKHLVKMFAWRQPEAA